MQQKTKLLKQLFKLEWVSERNSSTLIEHNTIKQQQQWQHNRTTTTTTKVTTTTRKIMQICSPWHRCSFSLNRNECKHEEQDGETHQIKFNSRLTLLLSHNFNNCDFGTLSRLLISALKQLVGKRNVLNEKFENIGQRAFTQISWNSKLKKFLTVSWVSSSTDPHLNQ